MGGSNRHAIVSWWNFIHFFHNVRSQKILFFLFYIWALKVFCFDCFINFRSKLSSVFGFYHILFLVRSIVIWIWRACMRQVISLNQNCKNKVAINLAYCQKVVLKLFRIEHYKENLNSLASYLRITNNN